MLYSIGPSPLSSLVLVGVFLNLVLLGIVDVMGEEMDGLIDREVENVLAASGVTIDLIVVCIGMIGWEGIFFDTACDLVVFVIGSISFGVTSPWLHMYLFWFLIQVLNILENVYIFLIEVILF